MNIEKHKRNEKKRKVDSLLFDLDGTLWNTSESCVETWNRALREFNFDRQAFVKSEILSIMGLGHEDILEQLFPNIVHTEADRCIERCYKYHKEAINSGRFFYYAAVIETLKALKKKYKLYLISNCDRSYMNIFLSHFPLKNCFNDTCCYGDYKLSKSKNIKRVIGRNQLKNPIYVGDTKTDEVSAEKNDIPFIWVTYGYGKDLSTERKIDCFSKLETFEI